MSAAMSSTTRCAPAFANVAEPTLLEVAVD
jgi:hypothetical protein